jgi:hypothetical protein
LKPYRFPPRAVPAVNDPKFGLGGRVVPLAATEACAAAPTSSAFSAAGTRRVVEQVGHLTNCPACDSSAESCVLQTWQGKIGIGVNPNPPFGDWPEPMRVMEFWILDWGFWIGRGAGRPKTCVAKLFLINLILRGVTYLG